jgi:hypothetical protein
MFRFYDYWEVTKANCKTGKPQKYIVLVTELMTSGNSPPPILYFFLVLRIRDILVWNRIRIWIRGSISDKWIGSGFGCGSCYFRH